MTTEEKGPPPEYTEDDEASPAAAVRQAPAPTTPHTETLPHVQAAQTLEALSTTLSTMASAMRNAPSAAAAQPFTDGARAALSSALTMLNGTAIELIPANLPLPSEPSPTVIGLSDEYRPTSATTLRVSPVGGQHRIHVDRGGSEAIPHGRIMASVIRVADCRADVGFYAPSAGLLLLLKAAAGGRVQLIEPRGRGPVGSMVRTDDSGDGDGPFAMKVSVHNAFATRDGPWFRDEVLVVEAQKGFHGDLVDGAVRSRGGVVCMLFYTSPRGEYTVRVAEGFDMLLAGAIAVAAAQRHSILGSVSKFKGKARAS